MLKEDIDIRVDSLKSELDALKVNLYERLNEIQNNIRYCLHPNPNISFLVYRILLDVEQTLDHVKKRG